MPKITIPSIDTLAQRAVDILLQSGSHEPLLFIYTMLENLIAPIAFMPDSIDAKQMLMKTIAQVVREQCKSRALTDIFVVTEAWMLKTDVGACIPPKEVTITPDKSAYQSKPLCANQFIVRNPTSNLHPDPSRTIGVGHGRNETAHDKDNSGVSDYVPSHTQEHGASDLPTEQNM